MKVVMNYFKAGSGKWYAEAMYETKEIQMFSIHLEVKRMIEELKSVPGLIDGTVGGFIVHVEVPEHTNNVPKLFVRHIKEV